MFYNLTSNQMITDEIEPVKNLQRNLPSPFKDPQSILKEILILFAPEKNSSHDFLQRSHSQEMLHRSIEV